MVCIVKKRVTFADQQQTENVTPKAPKEKPRQYEVEKILGKRELKKGEIDYKLSWKGYSSEFDIWVPEENLDCPDLLEAFENQLLLNPPANKKKRGRPAKRDQNEVPSKRIRTSSLKSASKATNGKKDATPITQRMKARTTTSLVQTVVQTHEIPNQQRIPQNEAISETRRTRSRTNTMVQRTPIQTPKMNNQPPIVEVEAMTNTRTTRSHSIVRGETRITEIPNLLSSAKSKDTPETRQIRTRTPSTIVNSGRAQTHEAPNQVAGDKATPKTAATISPITRMIQSVRAEIPVMPNQPAIVADIVPFLRKRTRTTTMNNNVRNRTHEAPNQVSGEKPPPKTGQIGTTPPITAIEILHTPGLPNQPIDIDDEITRFVTRSTRSRSIAIPRAVRTRTSVPQRH